MLFLVARVTVCSGRTGPHRARRVFALPLAGTMLLLSMGSVARAGESYYQSYHLGERAAGMAGAFTALANEATGGWYNPAGMVDVPTSSIGLTVSAYQFDRRSLGAQFSLSGQQATLESTDLSSFPSSFGYVRSFGLEVRHAIGLVVLVPDQDAVAGRVSLSAPSLQTTQNRLTGAELDASFRRVDQAILFGLGYAVRPSPRVAFGVNVYYALRHFQLSTSVLLQGQRPDGAVEGRAEAWRAEAVHGSLLGEVGVKLTLVDRLTLGLSVRTPNVRIHRSGSVFNGVETGDAAQVSGADLELESNEPFRVSLGIAYEVPRAWAVAADFRLHGAVAPYESILRRLGDGSFVPDPFAGQRLERRMVANVSLGGEYYVAKQFALRGGFFTNLTARPDLVLDSRAVSGLERANGYGFAAAVSWITDKTTLSLTANYSFAFGEVVGLQNGGGADQSLVLAPASRHVLTFFLGGAYHL